MSFLVIGELDTPDRSGMQMAGLFFVLKAEGFSLDVHLSVNTNDLFSANG
jgi:hypothetical protein